MVDFVVSERRERLTTNGKIFDLLLSPSDSNSPAKRLFISAQDWQTFALGDAVGYDSGRLWHRELPDHPIEVERED